MVDGTRLRVMDDAIKANEAKIVDLKAFVEEKHEALEGRFEGELGKIKGTLEGIRVTLETLVKGEERRREKAPEEGENSCHQGSQIPAYTTPIGTPVSAISIGPTLRPPNTQVMSSVYSPITTAPFNPHVMPFHTPTHQFISYTNPTTVPFATHGLPFATHGFNPYGYMPYPHTQSQHKPKIDFPRFSGYDPQEWTGKCWSYFTVHPTNDIQKATIASIHLDGIASKWWRNHQQGKPPIGWEEMSREICMRFSALPHEC